MKLIFGVPLFLELFPSVVVKNDIAAAYDAIKKVFKRGGLGGRRIKIDMQECNAFRHSNLESIRHEAANNFDMRHSANFLTTASYIAGSR